jgi:2-keto-3-deoxy-galactonokinase
VRLLEQRADLSPDARHAFLIGAAIESDRGVLLEAASGAGPVLVASAPALAAAWVRRLEAIGRPAEALDESAIAEAFRAGCAAVLAAGAGGAA